jgi:release factor glutamine methyltransferase
MIGSIPPAIHPYTPPPVIASMTIGELLRAGAAMLAEAGVSHAQHEAGWILESALGLDRLALHVKQDEAVKTCDLKHAMALFRRRASREPLQYVLGTQEFCGLDLCVTPDVLIPRPETELLVHVITQECAGTFGAAIADIGTGSGCIAIALAHAMPTARLYAIDRSPQALALAHENAKRHGVQNRIVFLRGDLLEPLQEHGLHGTLAAIVSNPPYIAERDFDTLQPEVRLFEPRMALTAGSDGLFFHRRLVREAAGLLQPDGRLAIEVGQGQATHVSGLAQDGENYYNVRTLQDMAGIERVVVFKRRCE